MHNTLANVPLDQVISAATRYWELQNVENPLAQARIDWSVVLSEFEIWQRYEFEGYSSIPAQLRESMENETIGLNARAVYRGRMCRIAMIELRDRKTKVGFKLKSSTTIRKLILVPEKYFSF